jgi:hypothetical protein
LTDDFLGISIIQVLQLLWSRAMLLLDFVDTPISEHPHNNKVANDQWEQKEIWEHVESREVRNLLESGHDEDKEGKKLAKTSELGPMYLHIYLQCPACTLRRFHTTDKIPVTS